MELYPHIFPTYSVKSPWIYELIECLRQLNSHVLGSRFRNKITYQMEKYHECEASCTNSVGQNFHCSTTVTKQHSMLTETVGTHMCRTRSEA
jgi:hypothetical protein